MTAPKGGHFRLAGQVYLGGVGRRSKVNIRIRIQHRRATYATNTPIMMSRTMVPMLRRHRRNDLRDDVVRIGSGGTGVVVSYEIVGVRSEPRKRVEPLVAPPLAELSREQVTCRLGEI